MARTIAPDGTTAEVLPANGRAFTLTELYRHVDCETVELVHLADGRLMWMDEDGKAKVDLEINDAATTLLHTAGGSPWDAVVGTVLITTSTEGGEGDG
jgi:uncharacterized membrane protein